MTLLIEKVRKDFFLQLASLGFGLVFLLFPIAEKALFGLPMYFSETALLIALLVVWFEWRAEERRLFFWQTLREERALIGLFLMLFLGVFIATILNPASMHVIGKLKSFYLLPLLLAIVLPVILKRAEDIRLVMLCWLAGVQAAVIAALIAFAQGWLLYDGRLAGPYQSANYLALLVAPGCILALFFFFTTRLKLLKVFTGLSVLLGAWVVFLTHSYATWAALLVSLIVGGILTVGCSGVSKKWWYGFLITIGLVVIGLVFLESGTEKWQQLKSFDSRSSLASRQMIWRVAVDIATDHPWLGIGVGNFQTRYLERQSEYLPYLEWAVPTPHNLTLHFWLEGGMLTLLGWLGIMVLLGYRVWSVFSQSGQTEQSSYLVAALTIVLFYLLYGLVDTPYMKNDLTFALWGSFGLLIASLRLKA